MFKLFKSFFESGPSNGHHLSSYLPLDPDKDSSIDTGQATVKFGTESNDSNMMNFDYSGESLTCSQAKFKSSKVVIGQHFYPFVWSMSISCFLRTKRKSTGFKGAICKWL